MSRGISEEEFTQLQVSFRLAFVYVNMYLIILFTYLFIDVAVFNLVTFFQNQFLELKSTNYALEDRNRKQEAGKLYYLFGLMLLSSSKKCVATGSEIVLALLLKY